MELPRRWIPADLRGEGFGASIPIIDGDIAWFLEDPTRCLLPVEQRPDALPTTRVHVEDDAEWESIVRLLLARGIVRAVADAEIPNIVGAECSMALSSSRSQANSWSTAGLWAS